MIAGIPITRILQISPTFDFLMPSKALSFAAGFVPEGTLRTNRLDILVQ